jgi:formate hydrogenlyase transcriptional activator
MQVPTEICPRASTLLLAVSPYQNDLDFLTETFHGTNWKLLKAGTYREALLVRYFVLKEARRMDRNIDTIPTSVLDALTNYEWPGNIRELQNVLERSILTNGSVLQVPMAEFIGNTRAVPLQPRSSGEAHNSERERILKALEEARGMVGGSDGAAARLGVKRTTLQSRLRKFYILREFH